MRLKTEPGALDAQGKPVPQFIIPGTERSARQLAAARGEKKRTTKPQGDAGPLFAEPSTQEEMF